jgi:hypothetical protein
MGKELGFEETGSRAIGRIIDDGKIAVQYCIEQTAIWIPKEYCEKIGATKILGSIEKIFTAEELDRVGSYAIRKLREGELAVECKNYNGYEIEIPSVLKRREFGKHPETDPENKIPRLIKLLSTELKK